ncbi:hypothetical protein DFH08DRAFT_820682 [Mycena albidolilacea]|uniref:N-acetyltransferase domain-containing protein n=1 Tax=Mycena albidolilacea TaxID=1033008 RepID=A0AAD6ZCG2_9AGAR|nr:hypothetical protein DFH08DRAFT_820682 [Mycena albidolilacea]
MPNSKSHGSGQGAYVRTATVYDLDELAAMTQRAFISNPPQMFFSGATAPLATDPKNAKRRAQQTHFLKFLIRRSWSLGARIIMVVVPALATDNRGPGRIVAATIWQGPRPPGAKKSGPSLLGALRMGLCSVLMNWGVGVMTRISELIQSSEHVLREGYAELKLPGTSGDAWYLQLAGVDPEFQGRGYMSMLFQEDFNHAEPDAVFALEATTPRSRDVYKHISRQWGKGNVDAFGVVSSGHSATGFPIYPMIRAP